MNFSTSSDSGPAFNFGFGQEAALGTDFDQLDLIARGLREAADSWASKLTDSVMVNVRVQFFDPGEEQLLGGALSAMESYNYDKVLEAFLNDVTSEDDWEALTKGLQLTSDDRDELLNYRPGEDVKFDTKTFDVRIDAVTKEAIKAGNGDPTIIDSNGNENNKKVWMTRANAKALGLLKPDDDELDALVFVNPYVAWDYDSSNGIEPDHFDFQSMALQELGHVLGAVSGVDAMGIVTTVADPEGVDEKALAFVSPMDLFRFSPESAQKGVFDITAGGTKYFSIDGGKTNLGNFSTGAFSAGGDGFQASHWKQSSRPLGVLDPDLSPGEKVRISDLDLTLTDVLGWDRRGASSPFDNSGAAIAEIIKNLTKDLEAYRDEYLDVLDEQLSAQHPGYDFSQLLEQSSERRRIEFDTDAQKVFDDLEKKLNKEEDVNKIAKEIQKAADKVWDLQEKFDKDLDKIAADVSKQFDKAAEEAEKLLQEKDPDKLAKELAKANLVELTKFTEKVFELPSNSPERIRLEEATFKAAQLLEASDKPPKEVEKLLKSSGPVGDPVGRFSFWRPWLWFWLRADELVNQEGEIQVDELLGL